MKHLIFSFVLWVAFASPVTFSQGYTIEIGDGGGVKITENPNLKVDGRVVRDFHNRGETEIAQSMAKQCVERLKDPVCVYFLGMYLFMNEEATAEEEEEGLALIESASGSEESSADVLLGIFYENGLELKSGKTIEKDINISIKLWSRAANNCNAWAQNMLAQKYYFGDVVEQDIEKAYYWIEIAALWDFPNAKQGVEVIGESLDKNDQARIKKLSDAFTESTGCGLRPEKPVVFESWGM